MPVRPQLKMLLVLAYIFTFYILVRSKLKINKMNSQQQSQQQHSSKKSTTLHYVSSYAYQLAPREVSRKQEGTRDICVITNTIMKRKMLRALEKIKMSTFALSCKQIVKENLELGLKRHENKQKNTKIRTKSLDPYSQYSRNRLLQEIMSKLKAKNQGTSWDQDNTTLLYNHMGKFVQTEKRTTNFEYGDINTNDQTHGTKEAINRISYATKVPQEQKPAQRQNSIEDASNITIVQPSVNSSVYRDLREITTHHAPPRKTYYQPFDVRLQVNNYSRNAQQQHYFNIPTYGHDTPNHFTSNEVILPSPPTSLVPSMSPISPILPVSPASNNRFTYQAQPTRNYHNEYESRSTTALNKGNLDNINIEDYAANNLHFLDINASNSLDNIVAPVQEQTLRNIGQSTIVGRERSNSRNSKQKIKIISQIPYKDKNLVRKDSGKQQTVKRTYKIHTSPAPLQKNKESSKMLSIAKVPKKAAQDQFYCQSCDRCCACEPQS